MIYYKCYRRFISLFSAMLVVFVIAAAIQAEPVQDRLESPEWFLNGVPAPSSATIHELTDSILPALASIGGGWRSYTDRRSWTTDTIGAIDGHTVIDLICTVDFRDLRDSTILHPTKAIKGIAVGLSTDQFRLVYAESSEPEDVHFESSRVVVIDSLPVLYTDSRMSRSGGYHDEAYWTWDPTRNLVMTIGPSGVDPFCSSNKILNAGIYSTIGGRHWARPKGTPSGWGALFEMERWPLFSAVDDICVTALDDRTQDSLVNHWARVYVCDRYGQPTKRTQFRSQVDTIGAVHGFPFVEVAYWYHCSTCRDTMGKVVAVETSPGRYRPVYLGLATPRGSGLGLNAVLVVDSDTVIASKGIENYIGSYSDNYWVWPDSSPAPISLYQEWVLTETLNRIVPKYIPQGLSARVHKGKWDFEKLSYETYTWRKEDKDSLPSGGMLRVQFGLKDHRLQPVDISFDSTKVAPSTN
jgi:hypothetical protein